MSSDSHQQQIQKAEEMLDQAQGGTTGRAVSSATGFGKWVVKSILYFVFVLIVMTIIYACMG